MNRNISECCSGPVTFTALGSLVRNSYITWNVLFLHHTSCCGRFFVFIIVVLGSVFQIDSSKSRPNEAGLNVRPRGTTAAAPPPFRPGNAACCGSCRPLITPYYCRLGDLWFVFMSAYCMFDLSVYYFFLQYFDTVGWIF